jgi:hypothetical protein
MSSFTKRIAVLWMVAVVAQAAQFPAAVPTTAPPEPDAIPLYSDSKATAATEQWVRFGPDYAVRNVTRPTLTPVLPPPGKSNGVAVIVAPGGAFMLLAMDLEVGRLLAVSLLGV